MFSGVPLYCGFSKSKYSRTSSPSSNFLSICSEVKLLDVSLMNLYLLLPGAPRRNCPRAPIAFVSDPPHQTPFGICKTATQFYIPRRRKMPSSASAWGIFLLAVAVVCGFRRCVRFSWGWGFKIFQDLCPLVIRKNSFNVPGHLSENL